jgi:hypothetical protein
VGVWPAHNSLLTHLVFPLARSCVSTPEFLPVGRTVLGDGALSSGPGKLLRESLMLVLSHRAPESTNPTTSLFQVAQLVDRRLAIARKGLAEAHRHLEAGQAQDAAIILDKINEDLDLLGHRLLRETRREASRQQLVRCGRVDPLSETN